MASRVDRNGELRTEYTGREKVNEKTEVKTTKVRIAVNYTESNCGANRPEEENHKPHRQEGRTAP